MQPPTLRPILAGWPHAESPFHEGERRAQERAGVADKIEGPGRRMIRAYMPDEHRELFERLPYFVAAAADAQGRLWASMLVGEAGFVRTPDEHTLRLGALPTEGDPLRPLLQPGHPVGLLGIELTTRRRNRVNGHVIARDDAGFAVRVQQSFGNCPQYIQARTPLGPRTSATSAQPDVARAKPGGAQGTAGDSGSASGSGSASSGRTRSSRPRTSPRSSARRRSSSSSHWR